MIRNKETLVLIVTWLRLNAESALYRFVTQTVTAARPIHLPNPTLVAIVADDEAILAYQSISRATLLPRDMPLAGA